MEKGKKQLSLNEIAQLLNISPSAARAIGRGPLLHQLGDLLGHNTTRCEDASSTYQPTEDLEKDFSGPIDRLRKR
ncbi:MAG: hypothetical protein US39_C0016G0047 [Microgenomates group bacterium GW2011_GWC1_37_12b]|uniref:Uncharacterized protein n=1 Tax=Candidatus Woesebacteria bacterium GW2011_GWB1_38_8b TaxID=1618571 RepID=A0A0G0L3J4_9BACT|nr:MAG: hypothetical protein US39_C0016G0047 [Microgenomates group bacterium GW2011_GWC1_37_12b]KKQ86548.1 MAG: hypothetical protein UT10_C0022G0009 [Candidatus Woesebacteria bacterium GW2011_GWB1_38_8b]